MDDNEVNTLIIEWKRNVLDLGPDMPLAQETYDLSEHDTDEEPKLPEVFDQTGVKNQIHQRKYQRNPGMFKILH